MPMRKSLDDAADRLCKAVLPIMNTTLTEERL
jgi:hypothetical protein